VHGQPVLQAGKFMIKALTPPDDDIRAASFHGRRWKRRREERENNINPFMKGSHLLLDLTSQHH
jgi:hypothetical protein